MKTFEKEIVENLMKRIEESTTNLKLSLKENNIIKHINKNWSHDMIGSWNGYGYNKLGKHLLTKNFSSAINELKKIKDVKVKKEKTPIDKTEAWIKRLSKLSGISIEEASIIAEEKNEYKQDQIDMMNDRQYQNYSSKRKKLIDKMKRDNPLRRIKNEEHARAILQASKRHNESNYEEKLEEAREIASIGEIEKSEVKEYARNNFKYQVGIDNVLL